MRLGPSRDRECPASSHGCRVTEKSWLGNTLGNTLEADSQGALYYPLALLQTRSKVAPERSVGFCRHDGRLPSPSSAQVARPTGWAELREMDDILAKHRIDLPAIAGRLASKKP
jgi:hypothetical protein